eukprot:jgi/Mesvir1/24170/Mv10887-RA.1
MKTIEDTPESLQLGNDTKWCDCPFCLAKRKVRKECKRCEHGKIFDNRVYEPWGIVGTDGEVLEEFCDPTKEPMKYLQMTSVRRYASHPLPSVVVTPPPSYDPATCVTSSEKDNLGKRKPKHKLKSEEAEQAARRLGLRAEDSFPEQSDTFRAVSNAVKAMAPDAVIRKVFKNGAQYSVLCDYKMCLNVQREHASNNVWFTVAADGVRQRCFDRDSCGQFRSAPTQMPKESRSVLFPALSSALATAPAGAGSERKPPSVQSMAAWASLAKFDLKLRRHDSRR